MKIRWKNKINLIAGVFIAAGIVAALYYFFVIPYMESIALDQNAALGIGNLEQYEKDFSAKPSIKNAMKLMEIFAHREPVKNYDKAIYYGKKCIELGCDNTSSGLFVNLWMASIYHKVKDDNKACQHLRKALSLDKEGIIDRYDYYSQEGFDPAFLKNCRATIEPR